MLNNFKDKIKIIAKEVIYQGFMKVICYRFQFKKFNNEWSRIITREVLQRSQAVCVLLYDPKLDNVVLIEQIRIAVCENDNPWLIELVAGLVDKDGENLEAVARREAIEEAGCEIKKLQKIYSYYFSPGANSEKTHLFYAEVDSSKLEGVYGLEEEDEDILVHVIPRKEATYWINQGKINNAATIIALQWLELVLHQKQNNKPRVSP